MSSGEFGILGLSPGEERLLEESKLPLGDSVEADREC